ncbi:Hypp3521 [Branchiostoma lanceolatum]|uniref:Hypp3521 protein n=1 Tax=Branchiostoma lanceolatum TaxID=7740 RepID=A0A8K0A004_BRALA|nr:Hypp3521 [Branchiostoma lanceolatum]
MKVIPTISLRIWCLTYHLNDVSTGMTGTRGTPWPNSGPSTSVSASTLVTPTSPTSQPEMDSDFRGWSTTDPPLGNAYVVTSMTGPQTYCTTSTTGGSLGDVQTGVDHMGPEARLKIGIAIGFRKDFVEHQPSPAATEDLPVVTESRHSERVFIDCAKSHRLLLRYSGYKDQPSRLVEFGQQRVGHYSCTCPADMRMNVIDELASRETKRVANIINKVKDHLLNGKNIVQASGLRYAVLVLLHELKEDGTARSKSIFLIETLAITQQLCYADADDRSITTVFRMNNVMFLNRLMMKKCFPGTPNTISVRRLMGHHLHSLRDHIPITNSVVAIRSTLAENEERQFSTLKRITKSSANYSKPAKEQREVVIPDPSRRAKKVVRPPWSVMLGSKNGFAAKLKRLPSCGHILAFHCVCLKLALACCDTSAELKSIKDVETALFNVWKWLSCSTKITAAFVKSQLTIKGMMGAKSPSAQQSVGRKLKRACHTRCLSFDQAVKTAYADFWAILQTLSAFESCPVATGLLKKMKSSRFLGIIIILENVLPHLADLSKSFQASTLNFSRVSPAITKAKDELREIARSNIVRNQLQADLNPKDGQFRHTDIKLTETVEVQVAKLAQTYTDALCSNIDRQFEGSLPVMSALSIFDQETLPNQESETGRFRSYGSEEIGVLADHFFE